MKNNKGITLVALVITIIVLLILAGVSISLVVGDNGIVSRATGASEKSKVGQLREQMEMALEDCQTGVMSDIYADGKDAADITPKVVAEALRKSKYNLFDSDTATTGTTLESWGKATDDTEDSVTQHIFYIGATSSTSAKDRLAVKVLVKDGENYPQIYTSYADKLGVKTNTELANATAAE